MFFRCHGLSSLISVFELKPVPVKIEDVEPVSVEWRFNPADRKYFLDTPNIQIDVFYIKEKKELLAIVSQKRCSKFISLKVDARKQVNIFGTENSIALLYELGRYYESCHQEGYREILRYAFEKLRRANYRYESFYFKNMSPCLY